MKTSILKTILDFLIPILLLIAIALSGCESRSIKQYTPDYMLLDNDKDIRIYVFDSCEYIGCRSNYIDQSWLAHKGNCKFCAKRNLKQP